MARAAVALAALEPDLRIRAIHADVTDLNTLARRDGAGRPMPVGLIDFGDLSRTWLAAELAVTIAADTFHDLARPVQLAREVGRGFLPLLPLNDAELAATWPMVVARTAAVAVIGDQQAAQEPDNVYVNATRDEEWAALEAVAAVPFELATEVLREAAGLGPARGITLPVTVVPPVGLPARPVQALDLSTESADLPGAATGDPSVIDALANAIRRGGGIPIGRWAEARLTDVELDATIEAATVHLGVDLFLPSGTPVVIGETGYNFAMKYQANNFYFFINNGGNKINFNIQGYYGGWHNFALVFDGATIYAYVDGSLIKSGASTYANTGSTFSGSFEIGGPGLLGSIDDVRFYSRGLSAAEIQASYDAQK